MVTRKSWRGWLLGLLILLSCMPTAAHNPHDPILTIAVSPHFTVDQTLFIGQYPAINARLQDVLRSNDGGHTWIEFPRGMANRSNFSSISVSPNFADDGAIVVTTEKDGVFSSHNRGKSWRQINSNLPTKRIVGSAGAISDTGNVVFFVSGKERGLFRTDDLGKSWREVLPLSLKVLLLAVSPDFAVDATIVIVDGSMHIHSSQDGGQGWTDHGPVPNVGKIYALALAPQFSVFREFFISTAKGIFQTTNFGKSFVKRSRNLPAEPITTLALSPNYRADATLLCTSRTLAIFKSTDAGQTWRYYDAQVSLTGQTLPDYEFRALRFSPGFATDNTVFLAAFAGLFKSTDGGKSWQELQTRISLVTGLALSPHFTRNATVAVSTYAGSGVHLSTDRGASWRVVNEGIPTDLHGRRTVYDVEFVQSARTDLGLFGGRKNYVMHLKNRTSAWIQLPLPTSTRDIYPTKIIILPAFGQPHEIFVGERGEPGESRKTGVFHSQDGGQTWVQTLATTEQRVSSLAPSPNYHLDHTIFAAFVSGKVYRSTNRALDWAEVSSGLPQEVGNVWLAISPQFAIEHRLLAGTPQGLYQTYNAGNSWQRMDNTTVGWGIIEHVEFSPTFQHDHTIFVAVRGSGIFGSTNAGISWEQVAPQLIEDGIQFSEFRFSPNFATDGILFGITRSAIYRSITRGRMWNRVANFSYYTP